ncbi:MAG: hypothetical protein AYK19_14150 [Theionarchaea archaeon DG-70-1]|nr:MAG: hypothetical protein AYK19_14150 [Theionarchaea archaeon DG-70-1]
MHIVFHFGTNKLLIISPVNNNKPERGDENEKKADISRSRQCNRHMSRFGVCKCQFLTKFATVRLENGTAQQQDEFLANSNERVHL